MLSTYAAKICCADLYSSELARLILGDSLHPGGLRATNRLGRAMGLQPGWHVLDLACGIGTSATALSRVFRCHVTGLELGAVAAENSRQRALEQSVPANVAFVRGDAEMPPFRSGAFDAVIIECATSLFADKPSAIREVRRLLRPGGVIGLSDVTVEPGSLPPELDSTVGMMLCLTDALPAGGYQTLLESAGFKVVERTDLSGEVLSLLAEVRGKLNLRHTLGQTAPGVADDLTSIAPDLLERVENLVQRGQIGYWHYVGRNKPVL
ncbi:MAG: class I SAM-dependent methyltransferase [Chloroflexi bacterium]|nr:class I SAM-dependent methyltransferase [Chloroflexota bacterium]MYD48320.1 class I SAM-dependent methyltransferase [Chloroflexota bacterium]